MNEFFRAMFGTPQAPRETDPTKYPRHVEIEDGESLLLLSQIELKQESFDKLVDEIRELQDKLQIVNAEKQIAATKLFQRLRQVYPDIHQRQPTGWRKYTDRFYYVGWDGEEVNF